MAFKNFPTCHCHQSSLDTASTPDAFAKRELELGTGYLTVTDHGTLNAARKVYDLAKKHKLTPIVGLEAYLRDDECPVLKKFGIVKAHPLDPKGDPKLDQPETLAHYSKYYHLTMHAMDAEAYEAMVRKLSAADARAEKHGSERKALFTWEDLEYLGQYNITMTSGCLVGVVQRHLVDYDRFDIAQAHYEKMRSLVKPGNFYVEVFPHKCDKNWVSEAFITYEDGTREKLAPWKTILLKDGGKDQVLSYARRWTQGRKDQLMAVMENRKFVDREPKVVTAVTVEEGFRSNECRPWAPNGDVQEGANKALLYLARKYGDKVIIGDDSHYAHPDEKIVQDIRLQSHGGSWRFYGSYHRQSSQEAFEHFRDTLGMTEGAFEALVENSVEWAGRFKDFKFKVRQTLPTKFYPEDTLAHTLRLIQKHGRMDWKNEEWVKRLKAEINLLHYNGTIDLLPYFFIDEEVCSFFSEQGLLTGPGRGSAAGLLLAYLLRITHVDPLKYGLSMERFLTQSRIKSGKMPDIDQDLSKKNRDLLVNPNTGWLKKRFGDCYAHISVDTSLKLRSAVKDVARVLHGDVSPIINGLTARFENAPQGISDYDFVFGYKGSEGWTEGSITKDEALKEYIEKYPDDWAIVQKCLGLTRQKAPHACGFVITNEPVSNFIPMTSLDGEPVTQYTAPSVEAVGALKMDFLGLNSLDDIAEAIKLIQERSGWKAEHTVLNNELVLAHEIVPYKGGLYSIWKLPEDQDVFRGISEGKTESLFQFDTPSVRQWLKHFDHIKETRADGTVVKALDSIDALACFTALDRPGPLDYKVEGKHNMLVEYAIRARGEAPTGDMPILDELLKDTHGVIVFQEGLQKVYQQVGQTSAEQADEFRVHISKKKMADVIKDKNIFMPGALKLLGEEQANELWKSLETFGQYGFNKSHATAYVIITYACAFLKHHFPLEWWTAVLRNADRNEVNEKFWPHCGKYIDFPDIQNSGSTFEIQGQRIKAPLWLLKGIGDKAQEQITECGPYLNIEDFCQKIQAWRMKNGKKVEKADKKTGELRIQLKPATTALNSRVISSLIISGAMDSLFPSKDMTVGQKIAAYEAAAKATGLRKGKASDGKDIRDYTALEKYQLRKQVLPALTEPLQYMVKPLSKGKIVNHKLNGKDCDAVHHKIFGEPEYLDYPLADGRLAQMIQDFPPPTQMIYSVIGYVTSERRWRLDNKNARPGEPKTRPAVELTLDVEGVTIKAPKWPSGNQLPPPFDKPLTGAIVIACLNRRPGKGPRFEDVIVVAPPLDSKLEEASPEAEEDK